MSAFLGEVGHSTVICFNADHLGLIVVYFDQRLGAAHSFFVQKTRFFKFAPKRWSTVLFPKNELFSLKTRFTYEML